MYTLKGHIIGVDRVDSQYPELVFGVPYDGQHQPEQFSALIPKKYTLEQVQKAVADHTEVTISISLYLNQSKTQPDRWFNTIRVVKIEGAGFEAPAAAAEFTYYGAPTAVATPAAPTEAAVEPTPVEPVDDGSILPF